MKTLKYLFTSTFNHQPSTILLVLLVLVVGCSKSDESGKNEQAVAQNKEYYTCTMHPQIISDRPGVCPICQMELIKKIEEETVAAVSDKDMAQMVTLGGNKQVLANVSIYKIKRENLTKEFTSYSYLDFVEQNRKTISARFNGRLEKLFVNKTGDHISKGQPLFEIYSPDLVQAQNEYLIALNNSVKGSNLVEGEKNNKNSNSLLNASRKKLEIYGLTANQIQELETSREIQLTLTYFSPFTGTVIEKKVQEGMYVNEGNSIYEIADLSTLWNISEIGENNLADVKIGSTVKLHLRSYPGEEFKGRVTFIYPVINQQTRTVKVRSEFSSNGGKLKPQMYGETVYQSFKGEGILVPADAVLFTGKRTVVWAKAGDGMFEARNVRIGEKFNDKYHLLSGLKEGDEIAATGGFLIDSESQLKSGMTTGHQHGDASSNNINSSTNKQKSSEHKEH